MSKYDIFISYSRRDLDKVKEIISEIEKAVPDIKIWFDIDGIESGDTFESKIISAIDNCESVLFVISQASMQSENTRREITYAYNIKRRVIPVLIDSNELSGWFLFKFGEKDYIVWNKPEQRNKLIANIKNNSLAERENRQRKIEEEKERIRKESEAKVIEEQIRKLQTDLNQLKNDGVATDGGLNEESKKEEKEQKRGINRFLTKKTLTIVLVVLLSIVVGTLKKQYDRKNNYKEALDAAETVSTRDTDRLRQIYEYLPMIIKDIKIGNVNKNDGIETYYGGKIYSQNSMYLSTKIYYTGFVDESIVLNVKLYTPDGKLSVGESSPEGYTFSNTVEISDGTSQVILLRGWGGMIKGYWPEGIYTIEIWYKDMCLKAKKFTIY